MRRVALVTPLFMIALATGCQALGFGEGEGPVAGGGGGGKEVIDNGEGGSAGEPGGWTLEVGERPLPKPFDPNAPLSPAEPMPLCDGDWPVVTRAPRSHEGYASAQYARFLLLGSSKRLPDPTLLRPEDFLAYYGDRSLLDGLPLDAHFVATDVDKGSGAPGYVEIRVRRDAAPSLEAKHFVIVLDVSPSMGEAMSAGSPRAQEILGALGATLGSTADEVSLITFGGNAEVVFNRKVGADVGAALAQAADALMVRAGNDLEGALKAALVVGRGPTDDDTTPTELIIVTDGGADVVPGIVSALEKARESGIRTSVVQLAKGTRSLGDTVIHDEFLDKLATAGGGTRFFIADADEASRSFGARFDENFRTALSNVTLSVTLPSGFTSIEEPSEGGAISGGPVIGPGRWYGVRHPVTACAATLAAAGTSDDYVVTVSVQAAELPDAETLVIPYDGAFLEPSLGALIEDAILEAVQHLRSGGDQLTSAETVKIDAAWDEARCAMATSESCRTLSELKALMIAASDLR